MAACLSVGGVLGSPPGLGEGQRPFWEAHKSIRSGASREGPQYPGIRRPRDWEESPLDTPNTWPSGLLPRLALDSELTMTPNPPLSLCAPLAACLLWKAPAVWDPWSRDGSAPSPQLSHSPQDDGAGDCPQSSSGVVLASVSRGPWPGLRVGVSMSLPVCAWV